MYLIDLEASGLLPGSYPVEVAIMRIADGWHNSWLVAPHHDWLRVGSWDYNAEAMHGLSLEDLLSKGQPVHLVAAELIELLRGELVFSDAPGSDQGWLDTLFEYGDVREGVRIIDLESAFASMCQPMMEAGLKQEAFALVQRTLHEDERLQLQLERGIDANTGDLERRILRHRALADVSAHYRVLTKIKNEVDKWAATR